ncbi:Rieske-like 2Fe-2S protein [Prauserella muralis]|nr:Rieske-like 2Fe-2S protein [Prauserella muralis]
MGQARPAVIAAAARRARARPSGNWFAFAASRDVRADRPFGTHVAGRELVAWRDEHGGLVVGPGACPHLGAPLAEGRVACGQLLCRWHGLALRAGGTAEWRPLPAHDDGVLTWVRLDAEGGEEPTERPVLPARPGLGGAVAAVARLEGVCEPSDVVANRLDPWHGSWFHPYSFTRLTVVHAPSTTATDGDDRFVVDVTFRVGPRLGVPVRAEFTCPERRTVVMRIVSGEGEGSVVETHATPLGPGRDGRPRTAVLEATIATSRRPGFTVARGLAPVVRAAMRRAATRLWRDDLAYAERRYALRAAEAGGRSERGHT